jgi:CheY-like chemotaxis protein
VRLIIPCLLAIFTMWLMIDDEEIVRQATCEPLTLQGLQLLEAPNGVLGLKLIREHATELTGVLLDLTMPGMSGHEVF